MTPVTEVLVRAIENSGRNTFMSYILPEGVTALPRCCEISSFEDVDAQYDG